MKKRPLNNLDLTVYEETLSNGLRVYVIPKENGNGIYATFSTNFGSNVEEFSVNGKKKMCKVPLGVAHFLEHQMFEQEDGIDPMKFFEDRGAMTNAYTSNTKTTYLFSGPDHFKENINYLLDFVQNPYMTDETVEKEKGIIIQELGMYENNPYFKLRSGSLLQTFVKHPVRYNIGGTVESVKKTTRKDLYHCYHTFYHPSNMFVVVSGNVDPKEVISIITNNQEEKEQKEVPKITYKKYNEPDQCKNEFGKIEMDITIPKISLNYKMNISRMKDLDLRKFLIYMDILFNVKFGTTSLFHEKMLKEGILTEEVDVASVRTDQHIVYMMSAETKYPDLLLKAIKEELENLEIEKEDLERKKRVYWSSYVYMTDDIRAINGKVMGNINMYGYVIDDDYDEIKSLNLLEMKKYLKVANFNHCNVFMIEPNRKK